jgi:hypothetical protein
MGMAQTPLKNPGISHVNFCGNAERVLVLRSRPSAALSAK